MANMDSPFSIEATGSVLTLADAGINVEFTLFNTSASPLRILKWNTPFDESFPSAIKVYCDDQYIPYDGMLVKRGSPTEEDFLLVPPSGKYSTTIALEDFFPLVDCEQVTVMFAGSVPYSTYRDAERLTENSVTSLKEEHVNIQLELNIPSGYSRRLTHGERVRRQEGLRKKKMTPTKLGAVEPLITGGTNRQREIVKHAYFSALHYIMEARRQVFTQKEIRERWFGSNPVKDINKAFSKIVNQVTLALPPCPTSDTIMISRGFSYELILNDLQGCTSSSTLAYTHKCSTTMWICNEFWNTPLIGSAFEYGTQAGTIVHEMSHSWIGTDDHKYGRTDCKKLARSNPGLAIANADNFEYFCEDLGLGLLPTFVFGKASEHLFNL